MRNTSKGERMNDESSSGLQRAREIIAGLSEREKTILRDELASARGEESNSNRADSESGEGAWDYQRQPWGRGWIQRERKVRPRKDGCSHKVYVYWGYDRDTN